jgi:outer membrane protein assembly factor BamB
LGPWTGSHGFGASPIVFENLVIVHNSQQKEQLDPGSVAGESRMMAFDRETGEDVWTTPLNTVRVCYSVPFVYEPTTGPPELICTSTGHGFFSLNPYSGKLNWDLAAFGMRVVSSPVAAGGLFFGSNGSGAYSGNYIAAMQPGAEPKLAYTLKNSSRFKAPYVPSPLAIGDALFLLYDRGFAACIDAPTGDVRWLTRMQAAFNSSPIRVNDKIYAVEEEGVVWVLAADPERFRVLAKNSLGEPSRSTPAVSGGRMFLRTYSHLLCVGGAESAESGS